MIVDFHRCKITGITRHDEKFSPCKNITQVGVQGKCRKSKKAAKHLLFEDKSLNTI